MKKYANLDCRAILKRHNRWRRGAKIPQDCPTFIGEAIDLIILEHREMEKAIKEIKVTGDLGLGYSCEVLAIKCMNKINKRKGKV